MEQPVVHFELVARDGTSLRGFMSCSEVFGCDGDRQAVNDGFLQLHDELPDDVTFYVSMGPFPVDHQRDLRAARWTDSGYAGEDVDLAVIP